MSILEDNSEEADFLEDIDRDTLLDYRTYVHCTWWRSEPFLSLYTSLGLCYGLDQRPNYY